jgi:hypothetical protein
MKNFTQLTSICMAVSAMVLANAAHAQTADPVILTFSTVGDSRQDPSKVDSTQKPMSAQDYQWLQNSKAWSRLMREISAKKPNMLFFNGDMIMGYGNASLPAALPATVTDYMNTDLARYYTQSAFWRGMVAPLIESGTYVVPVAGNHEVQCRSGAVTTGAGIVDAITAANTTTGNWAANITCKDVNGNAATGKLGMKVNEDAWRANMGDLIIDTKRLNAVLPVGQTVSNVSTTSPGASDGVTTDQSKLSYSFDVGTSHFAVINTDPAGADSTAPAIWLNADFSSAQTRGATRFFVFGHKPAYTYQYITGYTQATGVNTFAPATSGLDLIGTTNRDAFWSVIESYGATYFCGHEHTYNVMQPKVMNADGTVNHVSNAYQVLVGSGGSPFDATALFTNSPVTDRYYAFANVRIYQSGKVQLDAYGFSDTYGPTKLLQSITLH